MRKNKILSILCCISALTAIALPVNAKTDENLKEFTMPLFHVYGIRNKEKTKLAGKIAQEIKYIPAQIDVVDSKKIKKLGADNLYKALAYEAGIVGNVQGDSPVKSEPKIRGFTVANSNILVDGMKVFGNEGKKYLGINQDIYGLERVEILRGPSSTVGGAGSVSGLINMELKAPKENNFSDMEMKIGQKNEKVIHFDLNRTNENKTFSARFVGSIGKKNLYIDYSDYERQYFAPSFTWKKGEKTKIILKPFYQKDHVNGFLGTTTNLLGDQSIFEKIPETSFFGIKGWDRYDAKQKGINYEIEHKINKKITYTQKGMIRKSNSESRQTDARYVEIDQILKRDAISADANTNTYGLDQYITIHKVNGKTHQDTIIGADIHYDRSIVKTSQRKLNSWGIDEIEDFLSGKKTRKEPENERKFRPLDYSNREYGIYASHNREIGKWHLSAGVRRGYYSTYGNQIGKEETRATTGNVGMVYEATDSILPYIHWNNSFHPVKGFDKDGKLLKPTRGKEWEIGIRYEPKNTHFKLQASIYDLREKDKAIVTDEFAVTPNGILTISKSIGEVLSKGFEIKMHGELANDLHVTATYNKTHTEILKDLDKKLIGKKVQNSPEQTFNIMLEKDIKKYKDGELSFGLGMRYTGQRTNEKNTIVLPGVTVYDANLTYERGNNTWRLQVNNLLNKKYTLSIQNQGQNYRGFKGDERNVTLSYEHRW